MSRPSVGGRLRLYRDACVHRDDKSPQTPQDLGKRRVWIMVTQPDFAEKRVTSEFCMGLRPTYMDETHLESMSFDGVGGNPGRALSNDRLEPRLAEHEIRIALWLVNTSGLLSVLMSVVAACSNEYSSKISLQMDARPDRSLKLVSAIFGQLTLSQAALLKLLKAVRQCPPGR